MSNQKELRIAKWPFVAGDILLVGLAAVIVHQSRAPLDLWQTILCVITVALGGALCVIPFVLEYRVATKLAEAGALTSAVGQIQKLELVAGHISGATAQWQGVQEQSDKTVAAANSIAERMAAEVAGFSEFLKKANEGEKATLRLEVEKLRRSENEWLQIVVRMLDHVFALHQAAIRSGQPELIGQLGHFQNACRDVARRVGLAPFSVPADEPFDLNRHQLADSKTAPAGARVSETIAAGYTYQGKLLRHALVALQPEESVNVKSATGESPTHALAEQSLL